MRISAKLAALGIAVTLMACGSGSNDPNTLGQGGGDPGSSGTDPGAPGSPGNPGGPGGPGDPGNPGNPAAVDTRVFDYGEAMRTASLKLVGELPIMTDLNTLAGKSQADQKIAYEAFIDKILTSDPRFATRMIQWWRDTLKTGPLGGTPKTGMPSYDTAATYAAMVVVNDQPYTDLFTATTNTCPTYTGGTFTPASCANNAPTAGILTDPGLQSQYFANMAFRRVRFIQETFVCTKMPAEFGQSTPMGAGLYTSPWDFNSITGKTNTPTAKIDFQDTSAVICANCHTTLNHIAPMFGFFDANGAYTAGTYQVSVPSVGTPKATIGDWLPSGKQTFAWRNNVPVTDIPSLGAAIAKDPAVAHCAVDRVWNWAMSRGDIVNDLATIPPAVTDPLVTDFTANGLKLKRVIRNVFTSEDFTKF